MLNPQDLIEAYEGRAGLLSRCILYGLVEPEGDMNPAIQFSLAQAMSEELRDAPKGPFLRRMPKALKWAVREDVAPEMAIFAIEQTLALRSPNQQSIIKRMPEYKAYKAKLGNLLDG